jgi:hypothetical protein
MTLRVWTLGSAQAPGRFKEAMDRAYKALDKLRNEKGIKGDRLRQRSGPLRQIRQGRRFPTSP